MSRLIGRRCSLAEQDKGRGKDTQGKSPGQEVIDAVMDWFRLGFCSHSFPVVHADHCAHCRATVRIVTAAGACKRSRYNFEQTAATVGDMIGLNMQISALKRELRLVKDQRDGRKQELELAEHELRGARCQRDSREWELGEVRQVLDQTREQREALRRERVSLRQGLAAKQDLLRVQEQFIDKLTWDWGTFLAERDKLRPRGDPEGDTRPLFTAADQRPHGEPG